MKICRLCKLDSFLCLLKNRLKVITADLEKHGRTTFVVTLQNKSIPEMESLGNKGKADLHRLIQSCKTSPHFTGPAHHQLNFPPRARHVDQIILQNTDKGQLDISNFFTSLAF